MIVFHMVAPFFGVRHQTTASFQGVFVTKENGFLGGPVYFVGQGPRSGSRNCE